MSLIEANPRAALGGNLPPIGAQLADYYSDSELLARSADLATLLGALETRAAALTVVTSDTDNTQAAALVREIRAAATMIDNAKEAEKRPLLVAGRAVDGLVKLLNDPAKSDSVAAHKKRIEGLIGAFAQVKAEAARLEREEAARKERAEADARAEAARLAEAVGQNKLAGVMMDQALAREEVAEVHEAKAAGPIHDLARTATDAGTTGLKVEWTQEITDVEALKATLGPLRDSFTQDAVAAAIRKFRMTEVAAGRSPVLAGVTFTRGYVGNVR